MQQLCSHMALLEGWSCTADFGEHKYNLTILWKSKDYVWDHRSKGFFWGHPKTISKMVLDSQGTIM